MRAGCSIVSRACNCIQDAEILILDAQNSSECINLDAHIMLLDTQNRSIGIQLLYFKKLISNLLLYNLLYINDLHATV